MSSARVDSAIIVEIFDDAETSGDARLATRFMQWATEGRRIPLRGTLSVGPTWYRALFDPADRDAVEAWLRENA